MRKFVLKIKDADGATRETIPLSMEHLQEIISPFPFGENKFQLEPVDSNEKSIP